MEIGRNGPRILGVKLKLQQLINTTELAINLIFLESLYMLCFLNYHFIIVKNIYMLYTQKNTSLIVKTLTLYKCYEIFTLEA
jgi:hypothetical protein